MEYDIIHPFICTELSFEEKLHYPYWYVRLSNGITVYSKSGHRSWLQLKEWLKFNSSIHIEGLWFAFRDHHEEIYVGVADYFFTNVSSAWYGGSSWDSFMGGYRDNDFIKTFTYRLPELLLDDVSIKGLDDPSVKKGLIRNEQKGLPK